MRKLAFTLVPLLVVACDRQPVAPDAGRLSAKTQPATPPVFQVADGSGDDTQALLQAFAQAKAAGKGAVVQLLPGTFEIGMIEVREFFGTLTGSGKGTSTITNLAGVVPDAVVSAGKLPALITFIGGDVTVSNLSVQLSPGLESWLGTQEMNMLLFSDYAADFTPAKKYIRVSLNNIEVGGLLQPDVELWPGGPVVDFPYNLFNGVKFSMDRQVAAGTLRCNIDATVTNSTISDFSRGLYTWGCKSGNFQFGTDGGNTFTGNNQGLVVNENTAIQVTIAKNQFNIPDYHWNGVDLNTGEGVPLEVGSGNLGTYEVLDNVFNVGSASGGIGPNGFGIMDAWRYAHPEHPSWMKLTWQNNTFNALSPDAWMGITFGPKNALFQDNTVAGNVTGGALPSIGLPWIPPEDPNYPLSVSEGCQFLNNHFLQPDFWYLLEFDTRNYLTMGDLSNLVVEDYGVDNRFLGKTNYGHSNEKLQQELARRVERMRAMYGR